MAFIKKFIIAPCTLLLLGTLLLSGCASTQQTDQPTNNIAFNKQGQLLDLYLPKTRTKTTAIMFIHGGGFKTGDKRDMTAFAKLYAQGGFVTTSINYRLTPKHTFPAPVNDAKDALNWMKKNAKKYGYNPKKIVVVGYSAGGTLALNLGLNPKRKVAAAVSVAPATDIDLLIKEAPIENLRTDLKTYIGDAKPAKASPISQVKKKSAPVLLFHGDKDKLVPIEQSILLEEKLKKFNVPVTLRVFPDAGHGIMLPNKHLATLLKEMTAYILTIEAKE